MNDRNLQVFFIETSKIKMNLVSESMIDVFVIAEYLEMN